MSWRCRSPLRMAASGLPALDDVVVTDCRCRDRRSRRRGSRSVSTSGTSSVVSSSTPAADLMSAAGMGRRHAGRRHVRAGRRCLQRADCVSPTMTLDVLLSRRRRHPHVQCRFDTASQQGRKRRGCHRMLTIARGSRRRDAHARANNPDGARRALLARPAACAGPQSKSILDSWSRCLLQAEMLAVRRSHGARDLDGEGIRRGGGAATLLYMWLTRASGSAGFPGPTGGRIAGGR